MGTGLPLSDLKKQCVLLLLGDWDLNSASVFLSDWGLKGRRKKTCLCMSFSIHYWKIRVCRAFYLGSTAKSWFAVRFL
jgi:hypothetical protein